MNLLLPVVGGFASGVFLRSLFFFSWPVYVFVLLLSALCAFGFTLFKRQTYALIAIFLMMLAFGALRSSLVPQAPEIFLSNLKQRVSYEGIVVADPDIREQNQRITVKVTKENVSTKVLAVMPLTNEVHVGDQVRVNGTLQKPEPFAEENGRVFPYDKYLEARGIHFLIEYGSIRIESPAPWYSLPAQLARSKHTFLDGLGRALPAPYSALAGGVVIGGKTGLGAELQDAFITSGLIQIVVLSGYNVMIVAEWVMTLLSYFNLSRRVSAIAGGAALLTLVGIAGISATAIRAALMALIALYARATGKSYAANRALLLAVFLMLLWNPLYLAFDPGFGLSVAATAGLIWLAPLIEIRLAKITNAFWRNALATTLAAQIAVLPLLLYDTGTLSLVAIPANLLTMPVVPLTMASAAFAGIAGIIFGFAPILATIAGFPALFLTYYLIEVAKIAARIPFAALTIPAFPFALVLVAYAALIYIAAFAKRSSITFQFTFFKKAST